MNNIKINDQKRMLEITKGFAGKAAKFGSDEYKELKEARADFPTYKIHIKKVKRKNCVKGLTYDVMEKYITSHDNAEENLAKFNTKRGKSDSDLAIDNHYGTVRKWFFETYPEISEHFSV